MDNPIDKLPYEDGGHCMFYSAQEANFFFNGEGLTSEDRGRFEKKRDGDEANEKTIFLSMETLHEELESLGIEFSKIICGDKTAKILLESSRMKQAQVPIEEVETGTELQIEWPALYFIKTPDGEPDHVAFFASKEDLEKREHEEFDENDSTWAIVPLRKKA